jgi:hypothetical protein
MTSRASRLASLLASSNRLNNKNTTSNSHRQSSRSTRSRSELSSQVVEAPVSEPEFNTVKYKLDLLYDNFRELLEDVVSLKTFIENSSEEKQNFTARIGRFFKTRRSRFKADVKKVMYNENSKLTAIANNLQIYEKEINKKKEGLTKKKDVLREYIQQFNGYAEFYNIEFDKVAHVYDTIHKICKKSKDKNCLNDINKLRITALNKMYFGGRTKKHRRKIR